MVDVIHCTCILLLIHECDGGGGGGVWMLNAQGAGGLIDRSSWLYSLKLRWFAVLTLLNKSLWIGLDQTCHSALMQDMLPPVTPWNPQKYLHLLHPTVAASFLTPVSSCSFLFGHSILRERPTCRNMLMTTLLCRGCVIPYSSFFFFFFFFNSFKVQMNATQQSCLTYSTSISRS